jgi:hypothetical protein
MKRKFLGIIAIVVRKSYLMIVCLLLFGCEHAPKETVLPDGSEIIDVVIDRNAVLKYSDIFESVHYVKLETRDDAMIGIIAKVLAVDNKFVVLDESKAKMVFVFDNKGKFLNRIGSVGDGPEEYKRPDDIVYDGYNDELLVWSNDNQAIFRFQLDGTFVGKINTKLWGNSIAVMDTNTYLLNLRSTAQKKGGPNAYDFLIFNEKGDIIRQFFPFNKDMERLSPISTFAHYQDEVIFTQNYNNTVFTVNKDEMKPKYYVDFHKHNIPVSSLYNVTYKELGKIIADNDYAFLISCMETSSHVVFQYVYKRVIFDGYYSKTTKTLKTTTYYINDMYALYNAKRFIYNDNNDLLISFIEPQSFEFSQDLIKNGDKNNIKDLLIEHAQEPLSPEAAKVFSDKYRENYLKTLKSANIELTDEEIDFIKSINEFDNPILWIATLKK